MYLLRLDDASEHWNKGNWHRMHDLLSKYGVKPIIAIIPHNEDKELMQYPMDEDYPDTIKSWVAQGWTPALHGYNHVYISESGGINPVNQRSEFAGVSLDEQRIKISQGVKALKGIVGREPEIFVAPAHTFDENTLKALREETNIRIISDTVANDIYYRDGFYFVPQQSGRVRELWLKLVTFCYHPNVETDAGFEKLESFLQKHASEFAPFSEVKLKGRKMSLYDRALSFMYFARRK